VRRTDAGGSAILKKGNAANEASGARREISRRLAAGSEGAGHLAAVARLCFESAGNAPDERDLLALGFDAALAAWEQDPLHPLLPGYLLALDEKLTALSPQTRTLLGALAPLTAPPQSQAYLDRLKVAGDPEKLEAHINARRDENPAALFWVRERLALARITGDFKGYRLSLDRPWPENLEPVKALLAAEADLLTGRPEAALAGFEASQGAASPAFREQGRARSLVALGDRSSRKEAARALAASLAARPWQTGALLALHDLVFNLRESKEPLSGPVAALFYVYDKADYLDGALAALFAADPAPGRVIVLDNGSRDHTPEVVAAWAERFGSKLGPKLGPGRFESIRLPVNVGAPAARNWLIARLRELGPERYPFALFLDDDAFVPPDVLARFGAAVDAYPEAGVWGAKTVNANAPKIIQHADIQLLPPEGAAEPGLAPDAATFRLYRPQEAACDLGQFDYLRTSASVTGCCHLFRTETLTTLPGFDLQFSPSQCDDLDHDLMLCERGLFPAYQGHLAVRHAKASGLGEGLSSSAIGNILKLYRKRPAAAMEALRLKVSDVLLSDLARKRGLLEGEGAL